MPGILVQSRRDKAAARRFPRRPRKKTHAVPWVGVTDKLRSYGAAHHQVMPAVEHRRSKYPDNRAERSHQPTRQRERATKGFRSVGGAQRFPSAFSGTSPHRRPHHLFTAPDHRAATTTRFAVRNHATGVVGTAPTACPGLTPEPTTPRHTTKPTRIQQRGNAPRRGQGRGEDPAPGSGPSDSSPAELCHPAARITLRTCVRAGRRHRAGREGQGCAGTFPVFSASSAPAVPVAGDACAAASPVSSAAGADSVTAV
ncbi:hypothetical protein SUDANB176_00173 [Streptomyces sp. enrichment culture]